jgi:F0F1-type ATP synthase assembly protein I
VTEPPTAPQGRSEPPAPTATTLLGIGSLIGGCLAAGTVLGLVGDGHWGTSPLLTLLGMACGIVAGVFGAVRVLRTYWKG